MKLAPHRSITFWSGILAIGFICWAWWDSSRYHSGVLWVPPGHLSQWGLGNSEGAIFIGRNQHQQGGSLQTWKARKGAYWYRYPMDEDSREPLRSELGDRLYAYHHEETFHEGIWTSDTWILSYRALILPPLGIWMLLLLLRAKRRKPTQIPLQVS